MELYDKVIEKLKDMIGPDRYFKNQSDISRRCNVDTSLVSKHLTGQRGDSFRPFFRILDCADVKIIFPHEDNTEQQAVDCSQFIETIKILEQRLADARTIISSQEETLSLYRELHSKSDAQPLKNKEQPREYLNK